MTTYASIHTIDIQYGLAILVHIACHITGGPHSFFEEQNLLLYKSSSFCAGAELDSGACRKVV
jgi:hypothetical protein